MFGCGCGVESVKFKDKDGKIDQERLVKLNDSAREAGWNDAALEKIEQCRCPCHTDGIMCMC